MATAVLERPVNQRLEVMAVVENHQLRLDAPLPDGLSGRVRVFIESLPVPTNGTTKSIQAAGPVEYDTSDLTEEEWLRAASFWHAEDFADEPDIYTWEDGIPFVLDEDTVANDKA